ncbi:MAG: hypothetical protein A2W91_04910 [Bacteroidetes bacterium GWF2_38_335]|nr:MAG: hypothetical protein A2W91_04910 [Bacteroidetes bacterium GWF2_38_335]OFY79829.1 MAG: hypothetical protein A2281_10510 [Bacteroidetes bacterium RIFOXYA12_FULL_38_20]
MKTILIFSSVLIFMNGLLNAQMAYKNNPDASGKVIFSGNINDKATGEGLYGATIYINELKTGTATSFDGHFSIAIPKGLYTVSISYTGYEGHEQKLQIGNNTVFNYSLREKQMTIGEVVVTAEKKNANIEKNEMSVIKMKTQQIKTIPALMGEVDVIKAIQLMPGVQASGEGFSGFNVRGGSTDQNLILLDESPVYNASHLMGFFSVFNNDALKEIKLYKGDIPASYGGRLSSLLDIKMKEGNSNKISGVAGIGTISSRLTIEGPVINEKLNFLVSARRSYADAFLAMSKDSNINKNKLYFYDLNLKLYYNISGKDKLSYSAYNGHDLYGFKRAMCMNWGNTVQSVKWNHVFSSKLLASTSLFNTNYNYDMLVEPEIIGMDWKSGVKDYGVKMDYTYFLNSDNTIRFGFSSMYHLFNPGTVKGVDNPDIRDLQIPKSRAIENGIYLSNEQRITGLLSVDYGIRFSSFHNLGKGTIYNIDDNHFASDSIVYESGKVIHNEIGPEPRLGLKYTINEKTSVKASYSRTRQYIHLASNSQGGTPLDLWFPTSPNVKPQISDQYAIGLFKNLHHNVIEGSLELYYKNMNNQIDFKDNAILIMNPKLEGELRFGDARAYGAELMLRKQEGKLNGWISYTLSRTERKIEGINNNEYYPASYDKTHNISVVACYEFSKRLSVSANWVYITGSPVTIPAGRFEFNNTIVPVYTERNGYRMPDYHRFDLSVTLKGKEKEGKKINGEWNFSVYNAYNRKNAFSLSFEQSKENPAKMEAYKVYLFPVIPAVTYNIKF